MTENELQSERKSLISRLNEIKTAEVFTDQQISEIETIEIKMGEITSSIDAIQKQKLASDKVKALQAKSADYDSQVPETNRPLHMTSVVQKAIIEVPRVQDRNRLPEVELSSFQVATLKKDGYSDGVLQASSSPDYIKEFTDYLISGGRQLTGIMAKGMTEAGAGGVLVPIQWGELITNPPMTTRLRSAVNNKSVTGLLHRFPRIQTSDIKFPAYPVNVSWGGETPNSGQNPDQGSNVLTTNIDIQVNEVYCQGLFSISLLEDNAYGFSNYIPQMFQESLDVDLDARIISGTGTTVPTSPQPWGLNETGVVPLVNAKATGVSAAIGYKDLTAMLYGLPQQYRDNGVFLLNSRTLGAIADIVDGSQRPLFIPNFGAINQTPGGGTMWSNGTILGRPFIISENMPDAAQGNVSVYFADFNRLYFLLNRVGATVRVLDQPQYTSGNYIYALRARFGGRVVQPYAGIGLKHT